MIRVELVRVIESIRLSVLLALLARSRPQAALTCSTDAALLRQRVKSTNQRVEPLHPKYVFLSPALRAPPCVRVAGAGSGSSAAKLGHLRSAVDRTACGVSRAPKVLGLGSASVLLLWRPSGGDCSPRRAPWRSEWRTSVSKQSAAFPLANAVCVPGAIIWKIEQVTPFELGAGKTSSEERVAAREKLSTPPRRAYLRAHPRSSTGRCLPAQPACV